MIAEAMRLFRGPEWRAGSAPGTRARQRLRAARHPHHGDPSAPGPRRRRRRAAASVPRPAEDPRVAAARSAIPRRDGAERSRAAGGSGRRCWRVPDRTPPAGAVRLGSRDVGGGGDATQRGDHAGSAAIAAVAMAAAACLLASPVRRLSRRRGRQARLCGGRARSPHRRSAASRDAQLSPRLPAGRRLALAAAGLAALALLRRRWRLATTGGADRDRRDRGGADRRLPAGPRRGQGRRRLRGRRGATLNEGFYASSRPPACWSSAGCCSRASLRPRRGPAQRRETAPAAPAPSQARASLARSGP